MPGIAGIITSCSEKGRAIDSMVAAMVREPFDVAGQFRNEQLEVAAGWVCHAGSFAESLPVWNEENNICLLFSGETFADRTEMESLRARGHVFDTENVSALPHLYEEMGTKFLEKLNGWFSGVLIDLREKRVVLFNDRYGLGRIYVHENADGFYFASEAKSLLSVLPEVRRLDPTSLAEFSSCGCVLQNRTLFKGISLLPGASAWTFSRGEATRKEVFFRKETWENQELLRNGQQYYEALKETFARILPKYFRRDNGIGMSLTGGIDGRMIMAWSKCDPGTLPCYTFGGSYRECADVKVARKLAQVCRQSHKIIPVNGEFLAQFPAYAEKAVSVSDGAMDVTGSVELYANQEARKIAPIRLTGNYGSEIVRGNVAFKARALSEKLYQPEFVRLGLSAAATYADEARDHPVSFIAFKQMPWHHYSRLAVEQSQLTLRTPYLDNELVSLMYQAPRDLAVSNLPSLRLISEGNLALSRIPTDRGLLYRPRPMLTKMRQMYEEFTVKAEYAYDYGMPQWLAQTDHLFAPLHLERLFLGRHKFYHFRIWYRDQLSRYVKEILLDTRTRGRPYFQSAGLEHLVRSHLQGERNHTSEIHRALSIELIERQLIEQSWN